MRPIDADALVEKVDADILALSQKIEGKVAYTIGAAMTFFAKETKDAVKEYLGTAPTLDYAPVVHGEWIDEIEPNAVTASGREVHIFKCSACDFTWANKTAVLHYFRYCPNCGANMMDGGKKDGCL